VISWNFAKTYDFAKRLVSFQNGPRTTGPDGPLWVAFAHAINIFQRVWSMHLSTMVQVGPNGLWAGPGWTERYHSGYKAPLPLLSFKNYLLVLRPRCIDHAGTWIPLQPTWSRNTLYTYTLSSTARTYGLPLSFIVTAAHRRLSWKDLKLCRLVCWDFREILDTEPYAWSLKPLSLFKWSFCTTAPCKPHRVYDTFSQWYF